MNKTQQRKDQILICFIWPDTDLLDYAWNSPDTILTAQDVFDYPHTVSFLSVGFNVDVKNKTKHTQLTLDFKDWVLDP